MQAYDVAACLLPVTVSNPLLLTARGNTCWLPLRLVALLSPPLPHSL